MEKKRRVTMYDVARAANVTPQTVSRAFRNTEDISEETRKRILKIASELHYVMNNTASSLRVGNSRLIVVVYDNLINVYFSIMIDYLQNNLREKGYSLLMLSVPHALFDRSTYEFAVSHNAAGVVSFLEPEQEIGELIRDFRIPVLIVGRRATLANVDYIYTDDKDGGRLAAQRLVHCGAKRFAYFSVDLGVSCAYDRYLGFRQELERQGQPAPVVVDGYIRPLQESLAELFSDPAAAPEGVFCFNDMLAFDLLYYFELLHLPPVYVVGYDCVQQEVRSPTRLTSVGTDKNDFAARAAQMIVSAVETGRMGGTSEMVSVFLMDGVTA